MQDGFLNDVPNAIAQSTDGYLWMGTQTGLPRFDGVRFVHGSRRVGKNCHHPILTHSRRAGTEAYGSERIPGGAI
jgi:ligand-binding sensor domain-containing protein